MFLSLCYLVLQRVLQVVALRVCSNDFKELEIVVLRQELAILRRRTRRPPMMWTDRLFLAAASRSAARTLAVLHHHTGDPAGLASPLGGEALDVRASTRSPAGSS